MDEKVDKVQLIKDALDKKSQVLVVDEVSGRHMIAERYTIGYGVLIDYKHSDKAYCTWEDGFSRKGGDFYIDSLEIIKIL